MTSTQPAHLSILEDVLRVIGIENVAILYHHLERLGVRKEEIAEKPAEFSKALRVIFGQGATILEKQMISSIATRTGESFDPSASLPEALRRLKDTAAN